MANNVSVTFASKKPFVKSEFINLMDGVAKNVFVHYAYLNKNGRIWMKTHGWGFFGDEDRENGITNIHYLSKFIGDHEAQVRICATDEGGLRQDYLHDGYSEEGTEIPESMRIPCIGDIKAEKCFLYDKDGICLEYVIWDEECQNCPYHTKHGEYFPQVNDGDSVEAIITWHDPKYTLFLEKQKDGATVNLRNDKPIICPICGANYDDILRDKGAYVLFFKCGHKLIRVHRDENGKILAEDYRKGNTLENLKKHLDEEYGGNYIVEQ